MTSRLPTWPLARPAQHPLQCPLRDGVLLRAARVADLCFVVDTVRSKGNNPEIRGYINFHAYSQLWMSPWGYSYDAPKDIATMRTASARIVKAIEDVHGACTCI